MLDAAFPVGLPVYWRSHFLTDFGDAAIDKMVAGFGRETSLLSAVLLEHLGGAVARVGRADTAFDHRDAEYDLAIIACWPDPALADPSIAWTREFWDTMTPRARGVYVNYLGVGESADRIRAAYGDEKYARLVELKNHYDPSNFIRYNQNIKPSVSTKSPLPHAFLPTAGAGQSSWRAEIPRSPHLATVSRGRSHESDVP